MLRSERTVLTRSLANRKSKRACNRRNQPSATGNNSRASRKKYCCRTRDTNDDPVDKFAYMYMRSLVDPNARNCLSLAQGTVTTAGADSQGKILKNDVNEAGNDRTLLASPVNANV